MIVDDDQAIGRFLCRRENAVEATQCLVTAVVDWNDHIDNGLATRVPNLLQVCPLGLIGSLGRRDDCAMLERFNRRQGWSAFRLAGTQVMQEWVQVHGRDVSVGL